MHGWNDPIDPADNPRRPEPTDDPAWLTDRPAPRSSYLFGDEPDRPADDWQRDQPVAESTDRWPVAEPAAPADDWTAPHDTAWAARHAAPAADRYDADRYAPEQYDADRYDSLRYEDGRYEHGRYQDARYEPGRYDAERYHVEPQEADRVPASAAYGAAGGEVPGPTGTDLPAAAARGGRRRRRLSRPLVMGGAAAAATLVVSVGVAALALPGADAPTSTSAGEVPAATTSAQPDEEVAIPFEALESPSPSPSVSPSSAAPSPTPSRTAKPRPAPTPAQSRSAAASRQTAERQGNANRGTTTTFAPPAGTSAQAAEVVELVNAERAKAGCGALSIDEKLTTAAQRHSQDQADHQNMSHTGSDGSDPGTRLDRVGYSWRTYGENVAWNQRTPAAVMDAWMNSPGHRANILNCSFTEIGVGVVSSNGPYWTQVFAAPR